VRWFLRDFFGWRFLWFFGLFLFCISIFFAQIAEDFSLRLWRLSQVVGVDLVWCLASWFRLIARLSLVFRFTMIVYVLLNAWCYLRASRINDWPRQNSKGYFACIHTRKQWVGDRRLIMLLGIVLIALLMRRLRCLHMVRIYRKKILIKKTKAWLRQRMKLPLN
jgi:hypothetical protein